jgi:sigma-B regulation protein RsbU (phosphoserine phosphatase)
MFRFVASRGELIECNPYHLPLGVIPEDPYSAATEFAIDPGDAVIVVTDGVFEAMNRAGDQFGLDRLRAAIRDLGNASAEEMLKGLYERVRAFAAGEPQADDITIVVLRRLAGG